MDYYIHPSHKDQGDRENLPHVHVCFGNRSDKSTQVSVSLFVLLLWPEKSLHIASKKKRRIM